MNPLALMVKAPNIGGIVAQNEAAQAQVNDNALVRQLNLAKVQAAQQQLIKQQQLSDLFKTGKIDPYSEQGIAQIASIDAEAAKPYMDLYSEKLKNTREDAKLGFQEKELGFKERETNAKIANYGNQADYRNAQIGISRAQLAARQRELKESIGEKETKAFMEVNALVAAAPPEQQVAVAQQAMQLLQNRFPNGQFAKFDPNEDLAEMVALGSAVNNKNAKSKGGDGTDAVNDPAYKIPGYELTGEVVPAKTALTKLRTQTAAIKSIDTLSNKLADLVEENGISNVPTEVKREYERIYNQILFAYKEARNLGALQQAEIVLSEKGIPNPASAQSLIDKVNPFISADTSIPQRLRDFTRDLKMETDDLLAQSGYAPKQAQQQPTTPQGGMQQAPQQSNTDEPFVVDF